MTASLGLGLVIMALEITQKRAHTPDLAHAIAAARAVLMELGASADEDVRAFDTYMAAHALPQETGEQKGARAEALRRAADVATEVPLSAAQRAVRGLACAPEAAERVSLHVISDVLAGAELLHAATHGLFATLAMNLNAVDAPVREHAVSEREALVDRARDALMQVRETVRRRLTAHG